MFQQTREPILYFQVVRAHSCSKGVPKKVGKGPNMASANDGQATSGPHQPTQENEGPAVAITVLGLGTDPVFGMLCLIGYGVNPFTGEPGLCFLPLQLAEQPDGAPLPDWMRKHLHQD